MKFLIVFCTSILFAFTVNAQVNAPYSYYGLGQLSQGSINANYGAAHTGICFDTLNSTMLDITNPASYAMLRYTAFDVSLAGHYAVLNDGTNKQKNFDMSPAYFALGIPIINKNNLNPKDDNFRWGLSTGLVPYSKVSYYLNQKIENPGADKVAGYFYKGDGNTYRFFIGNGFKYKNFYAGIHANYLFGNIKYRASAYYPDSVVALGTRTIKTYSPGGLYWDAGLQYDIKIKDKKHLAIGATFQTAQSIKVRRTAIWERINHSGATIDTIGGTHDSTGVIALPMTYGLGVQWSNGSNFRLALNYKYTQWSAFRFYDRVESLQDNWLLSLGTQFVPNATSSNFMNRCFYRAGFYGGQDFVKINNTSLSVLGVTAGLGMKFNMLVLGRYAVPFYVNAGIDIGSRGTLTNGLIKDNYARFQVGVSLNDQWFIRSKYD